LKIYFYKIQIILKLNIIFDYFQTKQFKSALNYLENLKLAIAKRQQNTFTQIPQIAKKQEEKGVECSIIAKKKNLARQKTLTHTIT
jgi:ribosomal protein L22